MTNAEKYLNKEASARELREKLANWIFSELGYYEGTEDAIDTVIGDFFDTIEKPTLTEDERVILRNIREYNRIGRDDTNDLYIVFGFKGEYRKKYYCNMFRHLFLFIKDNLLSL